MRRAWLIVVSFAFAGIAQAATVAELKDLLAKGDYKQVVRDADRTLTRQDTTLSANDAYDITVLKAEALFRSGQRATASNEFASAARAAPTLPLAAWARASRLVISRSTENAYVPKTGEDKTPIDIINPDSRQRAFLAMAADSQQAADLAYQQATRSETLTNLEDAASTVVDLWVLRLAGSGTAEAESAKLQKVNEHAALLIAQEIRTQERNLNRLDRLASSFEMYDGTGYRRGISSKERDSLRELGGYLRQITDRIRVYRELARVTGGSPETWDALFGQVNSLQYELDALLDTRY